MCVCVWNMAEPVVRRPSVIETISDWGYMAHGSVPYFQTNLLGGRKHGRAGRPHGNNTRIMSAGYSIWANIFLVGVIPTPLKNMSSSVGIMIPNIWTNKTCSKPPTSENPPRSWWAFHSSPIVCVKSQMHAPYGQTAWDLHRAQRHGFAHPARAERRKRSVSGGPQDDPYQLWDLVSTMIGGIPTPLKNVF